MYDIFWEDINETKAKGHVTKRHVLRESKPDMEDEVASIKAHPDLNLIEVKQITENKKIDVSKIAAKEVAAEQD